MAAQKIPPQGGNPWLLWILSLGALVVLGVMLVFVLRRSGGSPGPQAPAAAAGESTPAPVARQVDAPDVPAHFVERAQARNYVGTDVAVLRERVGDRLAVEGVVVVADVTPEGDRCLLRFAEDPYASVTLSFPAGTNAAAARALVGKAVRAWGELADRDGRLVLELRGFGSIKQTH